MKTGLLFGVAGVIAVGVVGGAANVRAACVPIADCTSLGYKYTAAQCNGKGVACPFDTTLWSCVPPAPASGHCCGYFNGCGYNGGTSSSYDRNCQSHYGRSCYAQCKSYGYPDCNDMQDSCRAQGNTSSLQNCFTSDADGYHFGSYLRCEKPEPASIEGYCCGYTNYCGYSGGTSSSYDDFCLLHKKKSCYDYCKYRGYPDCPDMHTNCRASGGTPLAQDCAIFAINDVPAYATKFSCE